MQLIVKPENFDIPKELSTRLVNSLSTIIKERDQLIEDAKLILSMPLDDPATAKAARAARLKIRDNRTKGFEPWKKVNKKDYLNITNFIDTSIREETTLNKDYEEKLEYVEKYQENLEKERKKQLREARIKETEPYSDYIPFGIDLADIEEEDYQKMLKGAVLQYNAQKEEERKAEEERLRIAKIQELHEERKQKLLVLWNFVKEEDKQLNFGELTEGEFGNIYNQTTAAQKEYEIEQERIRIENERLRKEAEAKAKEEEEKQKEKERREKLLSNYIMFIRDYNKLLNIPLKEFEKEYKEIVKGAELYWENERKEQLRKQKEKEALEAKLKAEREKQAALEAELKAKREAEERAEKERLAEEERKRKEAEELTKAPIKEQLNVWINSFSIPGAPISNECTDEIQEKFKAFKNWALKEVEKL